jgi:hypothetical protein
MGVLGMGKFGVDLRVIVDIKTRLYETPRLQ